MLDLRARRQVVLDRGELDALRVGWSAARIRSPLSKPPVTANQVFLDVPTTARVFKSHLLLNYPVSRRGVCEQRLMCGQRGCRRLADRVGTNEVIFDKWRFLVGAAPGL